MRCAIFFCSLSGTDYETTPKWVVGGWLVSGRHTLHTMSLEPQTTANCVRVAACVSVFMFGFPFSAFRVQFYRFISSAKQTLIIFEHTRKCLEM